MSQTYHRINVSIFVVLALFLFAKPVCDNCVKAAEATASDVLFQIGYPDAVSWEFGGTTDWLSPKHANGVVYRHHVGKSKDADWIANHPSSRDFGNAGKIFTTEIEFDSPKAYDTELYFVIGFCFVSHMEPSLIKVAVNGVATEPVRQPTTWNDYGYKPQSQVGIFEHVIITIPPNAVQQGQNVLSITLEDGSFFLYDYLMLREKPVVPEQIPIPDLLAEFRAGPMKNVEKIVFALRKPGVDPHWYSNFGYYANDANDFPFPLGSGGGLYLYDLDTQKMTPILEDAGGNFRDPQVHYDAEKIVFSYLPAGKRHYNLYEIRVDGTGLKQLTFGNWDDIEPTYTANGDILFCSTRSKRWVQCAASPVATIHCCGPNGENLRPISANNDQDNTPWPLPDGRIVYMRWEYIDRSQMDYHHLWAMNPDGTRQSVFFGNLHPGKVMLAPKPVPGSQKIVATFSPGHGIKEHYGNITIVDPRGGPDVLDNAVEITRHYGHCDPWAFSENAFMAAAQQELHFVNEKGYVQTVFKLPEELASQGFWIGEPRPLIPREREPLIADQTNQKKTTGYLVLADIYKGRRFGDLPRGAIKDLLVLEPLPAPIHYNGGMEYISANGTFALTRIVGTVPVTSDGAACMELPALRNFLFVARDANGDSVKRMHSFTSVMPGEITTCIGCHETRTSTPVNALGGHGSVSHAVFDVMKRRPSIPKPISDVPDLFDYPRDIQPILDKHCVECHNSDRADGGINLCSDWTPRYQFGYLTLSVRNMLGDNRNRAESDFEPYAIGTKSSKLLRLIEEKHEGVNMTPKEVRMLRYWIETGANFAGTYAANFLGTVGYHYNFGYDQYDLDWPETQKMSETITRRCTECHNEVNKRLLPETISSLGSAYSPQWIFNMSYPEKSKILTAPLAKNGGGTERCGRAVFADKDDPDYQAILGGINRAEKYIREERNRFTQRPFVPHPSYVREMIRYGVLPQDHDYSKPIDPYQTDRLYWKTMFDYVESGLPKN